MVALQHLYLENTITSFVNAKIPKYDHLIQYLKINFNF